MRKKTGTVYLVGAGPGDPKLITVRGRELLKSCDAVVYDHLVSESLVILAQSARKFYVGKVGGHVPKTEQLRIERLLIRLARQGKRVVRLKGGDPFVFGRGGEEALALARNRIPFEIVPGVTAGIAGATYAGIPVTHRQLASSATFITAHEDPSKTVPDVDWNAAARLAGTLVIYMGMKTLNRVAAELIRHGRSANTPAAVISWASTGKQKTVSGTLADIASQAARANLQAPAVTIVGKVVSLRRHLKWFEKKPLFGKTVMVTRARTQASALSDRLEELGARVVEFPTIEIKPIRDFHAVDAAIRQLGNFDWLVFTSENGVVHFMNRLHALRQDCRKLAQVKIACVGSGTADQLKQFGLLTDLIPKNYTTTGLFQEFKNRNILRSGKFLLVRTSIATDELHDLLEKEGARATELAMYETVKPKLSKSQASKLLAGQPVDFITFTSASTAENFFSFLDARIRRRLKSRLVSIGPVTSGTIRRLGAKVYREAKPHTISGLVAALAGVHSTTLQTTNGNGHS